MTRSLTSPAVARARREVLERGAAALAAFALGLPLANCAQNETLGRSQLILISPEEVEQMADMSEAQLRQQFGGPTRDRRRQREIERLADRMAAVEGAPRPRRGFRGEALASPALNAFALPNGYTAYLDGLWDFARGDRDELASIMGHEMGHIAGRHAQERISQHLAFSVGAAIIGTAAAAAGSRRYTPAIGAALGLGVALGGSAFSREHEYEADQLGLIYAARAGYDPRKGVAFFARMEESMGDNPMWFLATHPPYGDRRRRMARLLETNPEIAAASRQRGA